MDVRLIDDEGVEERPAEELAALLDRQDGLVWVDIATCDDEAARVLSDVFGFHPMAVKDCVERNRVPKMHAYRDHVFVVGGDAGDPEEFLDELFRTRHGLLTVRTMSALSSAIYGGMAGLARISPDGQRLVAETADRFDRIRRVADGEREYLQGVIEFFQTALTIKAALIGQTQNEEVKRLTEASYAQNEEIKKISAWAAILFAPTLIGTVYGMNFAARRRPVPSFACECLL
ncbi:CorA family divalent cation transporter [Microbispora sp. ATCC PTA-5024]|uniref:CorA family divalent cation transporter n=1 Tax=Microbispora sp. ATCC PTA-5024 TaxID=316330 RepID=UPI0003DBF11E|nr:CorA family divalent cation transporter [Microbispora sp. ATCC PTA-5024]ETK36865.1 hypothetical protein MPTA5024_06640 [Microbispora sp. ATCC PTA-5024]